MMERLQQQELQWGSWDTFWNYCRANDENIIWGSLHLRLSIYDAYETDV